MKNSILKRYFFLCAFSRLISQTNQLDTHAQAKIVRQESLNIDAVFERKIKQAEVQKRM